MQPYAALPTGAGDRVRPKTVRPSALRRRAVAGDLGPSATMARLVGLSNDLPLPPSTLLPLAVSV